MNVIDNILTEWAYRCPDGIVDLNNPEKVKVLFEVLKPFLKEDLDDDILNALINTDEDTKTKVLKFLKKVDKNSTGELKSILSKKGIGPLIKTVLYDIEEVGQEDELLTYLTSPDKQVSLSQLQSNSNLFSLFNKTGLSQEAIQALINIGGTLGNITIGRGEIALITLLKDSKREGKGDVTVGNKKIEIKNRSKEGGEGSLLVPEKESRGGASEINNMLLQAIDNLFTDDSFKEVLKDNILKTQKGVRWLNRIDTIYKAFLNQKQKGNTKSDFKKEINDILRKLYKENAPKIEDYLGEQDFNIEQFKLDIAKKLAEDYYNESRFDYILFINPDLSYKMYEKNSFLQDIGKEITVSGFSDYLPRLYYKKDSVNEEVLNELSNTTHFQLRLSERGNVLDILNLNEIPLKEYSLPEVKEKLKEAISDEIKTRVNNILNKDIPSSSTYDVGIKVLKPILVVNDKKYPLKLLAISTKEIKDKEGNVIETKEVENKGTLYFATIVNNKATTLMLLDKEDDNDLYFQIKNHINRKKGEDKEVKILTPPTYVYEINLDELMGNKINQGPALVDPDTLEYILRTDYRKGANFTHKKYGTGKIINTSSGTGGEGDSNGRLDWIDVDYGKPVLKSGKLTPYRRFENILTLVSPLLK